MRKRRSQIYSIGDASDDNKFVISPVCEDPRPFSNGLAAVKIGSSRSWTYIDTDGKIIFDERNLYAGDFKYGYAFIIKDFGFPGYVMDKDGNKYLEEVNIYGMTKFNDKGYALSYTIVDKTETKQGRSWYMIHIERN